MNAITTSRTLVLAKPEKACAGVIVPVRTTAPTAIIEAVRSGKEPRSTHAIAATKTANRCHAGAVRPAGTGVNQMPIAIAKGAARFRSKPGAIMVGSLPRPVGRAERDPSARRRAPGSSHPPPRSRTARRTRRNPSRRHTGPCRPGSSPSMRFRAAVPSPLSSLNTWSPRSSVQTLRPTRPVSLSTSAITSERNPTPGRPGPASSIVPLRSMIEPRRSAPRGMVRRVPAAFQEPANSRHSPAAATGFGGSGRRPAGGRRERQGDHEEPPRVALPLPCEEVHVSQSSRHRAADDCAPSWRASVSQRVLSSPRPARRSSLWPPHRPAGSRAQWRAPPGRCRRRHDRPGSRTICAPTSPARQSRCR